MKGFPEPVGGNVAPAGVDSVEHGWQWYAHAAVHNNDPLFRDFLASQVIRCLHEGRPLGASAIEWLIFVLSTLQRKGEIPSLAKGRHVDRERSLVEQAALRDFLVGHPELRGDAAFEAAAEALGMGFKKARAMYYSRPFHIWRRLIQDARKGAKK